MVKKSCLWKIEHFVTLYYTPFKILICIHGIIVNSDLMYQRLCETEHLYYLFGSSSKRIIPLCHLVDDMLVLTSRKLMDNSDVGFAS